MKKCDWGWAVVKEQTGAYSGYHAFAGIAGILSGKTLYKAAKYLELGALLSPQYPQTPDSRTSANLIPLAAN
jgi:hypothetical protein